MHFNRNQVLLTLGFFGIAGLVFTRCSTASRNTTLTAARTDTTRTIAQYFTPASASGNSPDAEGFIRRWSILEPINKPNRSNTVFTDSYLKHAFDTLYFKEQLTVLPKDGENVKVGNQELKWHALDSRNFNVKLFRFAYGLNKPTYGVLFWTVTVVNSARELRNIRLAAGSNSASMWWVNGKETLMLSGDRRMVMDDGVSARLTLNQGKNIIRGAIINGPGMSDFCIRFLDEKGDAVKDLSITLN
jgi:hypothetical protein